MGMRETIEGLEIGDPVRFRMQTDKGVEIVKGIIRRVTPLVNNNEQISSEVELIDGRVLILALLPSGEKAIYVDKDNDKIKPHTMN